MFRISYKTSITCENFLCILFTMCGETVTRQHDLSRESIQAEYFSKERDDDHRSSSFRCSMVRTSTDSMNVQPIFENLRMNNR
jgi:hypothetical protein